MRSERNHHDRIEQEIQGSAYEALLGRLARSSPFYRRFATWADVIAFMRSGTSTDPRKDEVLRPIFQAHQADGDPRWRTVLLVIFWPGLASIHWQKRAWDPDSDELWQNVLWTFLRVICRIDTDRRPERLVQKVFNDTVHDLHEEYRRIWNRAGHETPWSDEEIDALGGMGGIDLDAIDLHKTQMAEIRRLREHMRAGRISEADFLLLVGTRVYGRSVADYARGAGLDYQTAKKRRQRAEAALRRCGKK